MSARTTLHATFCLERSYPHAPSRVFAAFADRAEKAKWFGDPNASEDLTWELDFSEGGRELNSGSFEGRLHTFEATYHDIVADERIVYSYTMTVDGTRLSASLATITLEPAHGGTLLTMTEQGAFFDDSDDPSERERGTRDLLEILAASLG